MTFNRRLISFLISFLLIANIGFAAEYISSFEERNISVLNDELRDINRRLLNTSSIGDSVDLGTEVTGILPLANGGTSQDFSSLSAGSLLSVTAGGALLEVGLGASGQILTASSTIPYWATTVSSDASIELFTTPGADTWTCPAGTTKVRLVMAGGGGGGGGAENGDSGGAGGGAGGVISDCIYSVSAGSYDLVVGAGGAGGLGDPSSATSGSDGADSTFDATITATKGFGGADGGSGIGVGGAGGVISSGSTVSFNGLDGADVVEVGTDPAPRTCTGYSGGYGGDSGAVGGASGGSNIAGLGGEGADGSISYDGYPAEPYTGGGGGGGSTQKPADGGDGSAGAGGFVMVIY